MKRTLLSIFSDPHGGHKLGLCNPETILEDDGSGESRFYSPELTVAQDVLWEVYSKGIEEVSHLAKDDEVCVMCLGDETHGNKYVTEQVSTRIADQFIIAEYNFYPWIEKIKNIKAIRIAKGTGAHEFGEGSSSIMVSKLLRNKFPELDIRPVYHGLLKTNGVLIDYAHHRPTTGVRNWLRGNEARYYLRSLMMDEINSGKTPPHIVLRGHYHDYIKEYLSIRTNGHEYESWITIIPSMDFLGDFARQVSKSPFKVTNGIVTYEIIDGRIYDIHYFGCTTDIRTVEEL
jgi:hypothetical protein